MNSKNIFVLLTLFLSLTITKSFAQNNPRQQGQGNNQHTTSPQQPPSSFWDKIYVGGNLGAQFGNVTQVNISPMVGYRITKNLSAGVGVTYQYYSIRSYNYETHIYGGRVFGRYQILSFLFLHAEFEELNWNCPRQAPTGYTTERLWVPGMLAGGGFSQPIAGKSSIFIMGLYNFLYGPCSPYGSPFVLRIGGYFGF